MHVTTRLTLAWTVAGLVVFGGYGFALVQRERADLVRSVEREVSLLGTSVQVAVENALRDGQLEDADETAAGIETIDATVDVAVFDRDGRLLLSTGPSATRVSPIRAEVDAPALRYVPADAPTRLLFVAPLHDGRGGARGTIVVSRSLADLDADLSATFGTVAVTVGLFVLTSAALGWALGRAYIGQPLGALVVAMRRVRGGELRPDLATGRSDEIGAVATEFDHMLADLAEARAGLVAASESRRSLERALQQADKLATVGQLAATLAHEIGSPLQVLHGRAQALLRRPDDPDRVARHAEILVRETERITRIVQQLLAIARPRGPRGGACDLAALVRQTVELYELEARRRGVTLLATLPTAARVAGDPDRLQQIAVNLVANALVATPSGRRVHVGLEERGVDWVLEVRDDGEGMSADVADRVFEPFFTTRAAEGGTGLGLAVVKGIVDEHGGQVVLDTAPGRGSTFRVHLPRPEAA